MKGEYGERRGIFERQQREYQTSEEEESRSSGGCSKRAKQAETSNATDGASIEVVRRPRGRPPGSKNKPKPPIFVTRDTTESAMFPHILEVPGGLDVIDAIARFARRRNAGLCVLTGTGTVANVTLRQPSTTTSATSSSTITFHGRFDILSISATFLPPSSSSVFSQPFNGFKISLAGAQGQIVGGSVVGSLLAAGTVVVVAASFSSPTFHRLPGEDDMSTAEIAAAVGASEASPHHQNPVECSGGMSMYSCHLPSDVIWAPTPRLPQHPQQQPY
ncbi:AT-hook motif nuclear-localized protein 28 [Magnolia sinica]|uniref:AT-hook motif nuclear-localized protein 28 n=1 Tax=Magnolia sinica TaxID=86752 RepID=UPI002659CD86|nr:AT-hook motif nuclear-localized protein 28 [Magnolia sinica]